MHTSVMSQSWMMSNKIIKEIIVYRSLSNNVFVNLALEDWLLHKVDYLSRRILLLWRNKPTVVIGRYQNPWLEADYEVLNETNTVLARRRSGGGAVYHDLGNLNCSFFAHRSDYDRTRNLQLVCDAINKEWPQLSLYIGQRHDILCQDRKVSGSAARVGKDHTYHHFTLLMDSDRKRLHSLLRTNHKLIFSSSNATQSVPSPTINLNPLTNGDMTFERVCQCISQQFYNVHNVQDKHYQIVDIDPFSVDGVSDIVSELSSEQWIWNKTPPFTVQFEKEQLQVKNGIIADTTIATNLTGLSFKNYLQQHYMRHKN